MPAISDYIGRSTCAIILNCLSKKDSYGYEIKKSIMLKTGNEYKINESTLYTAFRRLEKEGFIKSSWGNEVIGARRRYYSITPLGKTKLLQYRKNWEHVKLIINKLLG